MSMRGLRRLLGAADLDPGKYPYRAGYEGTCATGTDATRKSSAAKSLCRALLCDVQGDIQSP